MHAGEDGCSYGCMDAWMYACMHVCMYGLGRSRLLHMTFLESDARRLHLRLTILESVVSLKELLDEVPVIVLSLAIAVACTMAFRLSRSRGRRRSSTGCRLAKEEDAMITTINIGPD